MPFCINCSKEIQIDWKTCPYCGKPNVLSHLDKKQKNKYVGTIGSNDGGYGKNSIPTSITKNGKSDGAYDFDISNLSNGFEIEKRYRIEQKLGSGGFGTVYKAWDNNVDRNKALKVIDNIFYDDKRVIADLKHEAQLLMDLNSHYVVRIWDIHLAGEIKFIDMEYLEGGNLEDLLLLYSNRKVPEVMVLKLIEQISKGMLDIHKHRIIHKDLKPQNIMLTKSGSIKIMDFGISETFRSSKSRLKETSKSGTPIYMSPEQLLGQNVGRESDIWSFGVMMYELLIGKPMFTGSSSNEVFFQIERRNFKPIIGVNPKLNDLLSNCLNRDYRERFSSFDKVLEHLTNSVSINNPKVILKSKTMNKANSQEKIIANKMIFVQGGTFQMGSNQLGIEKPIHSVTLNSFFIGKYQVTQKEWKAIMGSNPSDFKGDNLPVETVNWYDAVEFCNKKSKKEGFTSCYSGSGKNTKCNFSANGYRLPTEAEWEFAARSGNKSIGYKYSGSDDIEEVAEYAGNNGKSTKSFGGKKANELGIYDMSGNVWEWCNDWYEDYSSDSQTNPQGPSSGSYRVNRGGSWHSHTEYCRVANRYNDFPVHSDSDVGFRLSHSSR